MHITSYSSTLDNISTPLIVRPREDGNYEIISGHRRRMASELAELKVAYGGLRQDHQSILAFPTTQAGQSTLHAPNIPYVEMGVGIGNILRIGEVYGIFRLTQWQDNNTPWWAVRFRLHLGM